MKIFGLQLDIVWEDAAANRARVKELMDSLAPPAGSLVVLPEMTCTGFTQDVAAVAEGVDGATGQFYADLARAHDVTLVAGLVGIGQHGLGRNLCLTYSPHGRMNEYCKIHPFTFGGETKFFEKGDRITTFEWGSLKVAPFVCYDLRFPELFRSVAGVEVYTVIANWPAARERHWMTLLQARAIENQAYVVGINRCGSDPKNRYSGRSLIVDPQGAILADGGEGEGWVQAELDLPELRAYRERFPALSDRRDLSDFLAAR